MLVCIFRQYFSVLILGCDWALQSGRTREAYQLDGKQNLCESEAIVSPLLYWLQSFSLLVHEYYSVFFFAATFLHHLVIFIFKFQNCSFIYYKPRSFSYL